MKIKNINTEIKNIKKYEKNINNIEKTILNTYRKFLHSKYNNIENLTEIYLNILINFENTYPDIYPIIIIKGQESFNKILTLAKGKPDTADAILEKLID